MLIPANARIDREIFKGQFTSREFQKSPKKERADRKRACLRAEQYEEEYNQKIIPVAQLEVAPAHTGSYQIAIGVHEELKAKHPYSDGSESTKWKIQPELNQHLGALFQIAVQGPKAIYPE